MRRTSFLSSVACLATVLGLGQLVGCGESSDDSSAAQQSAQRQRDARVAACHLNDGTVAPDEDPRACDPGDKKKTTICHIPPGNPANAHTLCVGNPAVSHHVQNHGDYLGPCKSEPTCPPPVGPGPGGSGGGSDDTGGSAGSAGSAGSGDTGGSGGATGGPVATPDAGTLIP